MGVCPKSLIDEVDDADFGVDSLCLIDGASGKETVDLKFDI